MPARAGNAFWQREDPARPFAVASGYLLEEPPGYRTCVEAREAGSPRQNGTHKTPARPGFERVLKCDINPLKTDKREQRKMKGLK